MLKNDICQEVMGFLENLRRDLPGIFSGRRPDPSPSPKPHIRPDARSSGHPTPDAAGIGRKMAGGIIKGRIKNIGSSMGLEYGRIFIKDQKTLWASCSGKRNLNFNWRLAAAPPEILDYVVIHELCHLREMNHSKKFWGLVGEACPDYKARKKWLNDHSRELRNGRELLTPVNRDS